MTNALTLPSMGGSIESYIQSVNSFPILSQEEETSLARRLWNQGDLEAAQQLILSHLRFVVAIARGYKGYGLPQADLIQEGNIGLMKAVKRFDPERGVRLVSFAVHWIKAEIHEFIMRNWRLVKIATTKQQRKLFFNLRSMKQGLDTMNPQEVDAMATQLGVKSEEVVEMEKRFNGSDISLEPISDEEDDAFSPISYLTDGEEPSQILENEQITHLREKGLQQSLACLDDRSRHIIEARWLREKDTATLHDLAAELGVSAERVRQIEAKALQKMRGALATTA
ncbi:MULTISPECIES: RNA polymerase sigma factor RpoH [Nitrosomonas]|uniref:RNA polymerase sigma factor RpoH n=1 Tax=Nitrosomonas oligotropha TaxID=42354 RepID=A0A1H8TYH6_9PROT|nr:RNA polymerase sigma factor RpoH [Nitrosomonas oligotropha]PTQ74686.1 RNA polymerase RpoH-like sigma 32 subunit [Nitrosomonas oligotropha]SDX38038.1 RNA polymerase, sigma 32 subunit, RpoH [Nitrosomonas oligotropha]SEO96039.1 RNA polymerase, sigma 32 subunit, RpoH [Nitrosomonas oligotropha]